MTFVILCACDHDQGDMNELMHHSYIKNEAC